MAFRLITVLSIITLVVSLFSISLLYGTKTDFKKIISVNSNKCVDLNYSQRLRNFGNILQWECHGFDNQLFQLEYRGKISGKGNSIVAIKSKVSGKCLDVLHWSTRNGANIIQYTCHYGANQLWEIRPVDKNNPRQAYLVSMHSKKCMDVWGVSKNNGANIYIWDCWGGPNQRWYVEPWE